MNKNYLLAVTILLAACAEIPNFLIDRPLNGGVLGDFISLGDAEWVLEDGTLSAVRGESSGYVYTKEIYADFDMSLEVFIEADTNSGIYVRCDPQTINPMSCYEFNIWDAHTNPDSKTGAIVGISPPQAEVSTVGKWNTMRLRLEDDHLQFWVNDVMTNDVIDGQFAAGVIALQFGGADGMVRFRNIEIDKL